MNIPFFEFRINKVEREALDSAYARVMNKGIFINGEEVKKFESEIEKYLQVGNIVSTGNGYDALYIGLKILSKEPLNILVQANVFPGTLNAILNAGHNPVFCDFDYEDNGIIIPDKSFLDRYEIDLILPVHYFGKVSSFLENYDHEIPVFEDFSQSFGSEIKTKKAGTFGKWAAASLYPTKNLGAFGDAGLLICPDEDLANKTKDYCNYGSEGRFNIYQTGVNSRLDEIQAAFLREKLKMLNAKLQDRRKIARYYFDNLGEIEGLLLPKGDIDKSTFHIFEIKSDKRDELRQYLSNKGIQTLIHYPHPVFEQEAFEKLDYSTIDKENTSKWHKRILSLPLYPGMHQTEQEYVVKNILNFFSS